MEPDRLTRDYVLLLAGERCEHCLEQFAPTPKPVFPFFVRLRADWRTNEARNWIVLCLLCQQAVETYRRKLALTMR